MSVKDTSPYNRTWWKNPVNWRDDLPRKIAIMQRLESLEHQNTLKFRGYRLNMKERRYRLYQDYCDYTDLLTIMEYYVRIYEPRLNYYMQLRQPLEDEARERFKQLCKDQPAGKHRFSDIKRTLSRLYFKVLN
jgi:hypothetical protein